MKAETTENISLSIGAIGSFAAVILMIAMVWTAQYSELAATQNRISVQSSPYNIPVLVALLFGFLGLATFGAAKIIRTKLSKR